MTNETLKKRVIDDINYIKTETENLEKRLISHNLSAETSKQIQSVLDYFAVTDFSFISKNMTQDDLLTIKNRYSPYKLAMESFIAYPDNERLKKFIEASSMMHEYIEHINSGAEKTVFPPLYPENLHDELQEISKRIKSLEQEQKPLNELQIRSEQDKKELAKKIDEIKQNIDHLQSSDIQVEIRGFLTQAKELLDKAKGSEDLLHGEIQELKKAKEGHIAYNLSKELQHKSDDLKNEYEKKIGTFSWKPWKLNGFNGAITLVLFVNIITWIIYLFAADIANICLETKRYYRLEFWHFMMLKLTINIPLIIYVAFALNEYTKAKKLYEEFDYKRILAQTLMNNYNQFKTDFTDDKDKLIDLIKAPLEKIFENPVHSIYGDKSGDKNIGLDQLEKITSIIEKMKK